jgi:hypothetical protein
MKEGVLDLTAEKPAYCSRLSHPRTEYRDVEMTEYCAKNVDQLWTPSHESNSRPNYNYH